MKHFKNGSSGSLAVAGASYPSAVIVEVNHTHIEFDDGSGNRKFASYDKFAGFDYSSDVTPLTQKAVPGATINQGATLVGTLVAMNNGYLEYQDPLGTYHAYGAWSAFDLP